MTYDVTKSLRFVSRDLSSVVGGGKEVVCISSSSHPWSGRVSVYFANMMFRNSEGMLYLKDKMISETLVFNLYKTKTSRIF
jgi:hypothetical protein